MPVAPAIGGAKSDDLSCDLTSSSPSAAQARATESSEQGEGRFGLRLHLRCLKMGASWIYFQKPAGWQRRVVIRNPVSVAPVLATPTCTCV